MASLNPLTRELVFKIVFYGPGLGGKTTTLQYIHATTKPEHRGKMVSLATPTDRTLYFDFLPLRVPRVRGMSVRLQLFTVPGQVYYSATRKLVLSGADGVVFVADSQGGRLDANQESLEDLNANLLEHNKALQQMPHTFHWNKRDLSDLVPLEELDTRFNVHGAPSLGTVGTRGDGVFEGLERITRLVLRHYESELPKHEQPVMMGLSTAGGPGGGEISIAEAIRGLAEAPLVSKVTPVHGMAAVRHEVGPIPAMVLSPAAAGRTTALSTNPVTAPATPTSAPFPAAPSAVPPRMAPLTRDAAEGALTIPPSVFATPAPPRSHALAESAFPQAPLVTTAATPPPPPQADTPPPPPGAENVHASVDSRPSRPPQPSSVPPAVPYSSAAAPGSMASTHGVTAAPRAAAPFDPSEPFVPSPHATAPLPGALPASVAPEAEQAETPMPPRMPTAAVASMPTSAPVSQGRLPPSMPSQSFAVPSFAGPSFPAQPAPAPNVPTHPAPGQPLSARGLPGQAFPSQASPGQPSPTASGHVGAGQVALQPGTPTIAPPPGTSHFSMAELWPDAERDAVRQTETLIGARDAHGAVLACDLLLTRLLASAAALAGAVDAPRDPGLVALLLGLSGRRYLAFRAAVRAARQKEDVSSRDALECFTFVLEARGARDAYRR